MTTITPNKLSWDGSNCFLNATLRGLLHIPQLHDHLLMHIPDLQEFAQTHDSAPLRTRLLAPHQNPKHQHCAIQTMTILFNAIREEQRAPLTFKQQVTRIYSPLVPEQQRDHPSVDQDCFELALIPSRKGMSLIDVIRETRLQSTPPTTNIVSEKTEFLTPPNTLFITIHQSSRLKTPATFHLGPEFSQNKEGADYEVVYAARHTGATTESGAYSAIVKINGTWFYDQCHGQNIVPIIESTALDYLEQACMLFCRRIHSCTGQNTPVRSVKPLSNQATATPQRHLKTIRLTPRPFYIQSDRKDCLLTATLQLMVHIPELAHDNEFSRNYGKKKEMKTAITRIRDEQFKGVSQTDPQDVIRRLEIPLHGIDILTGQTSIPDNALAAITKGHINYTPLLRKGNQWVQVNKNEDPATAYMYNLTLPTTYFFVKH